MTPVASPTTALALTASQPNQREQLSAAAKQFEAIFVRQMLSAARKTDLGGEKGLFDSEAMGTFRQMQDDRFAEIASQNGSLGMAKMIEAQLTRMLPAASPADAGGKTDVV
jgi:flagellar protein FlgJ